VQRAIALGIPTLTMTKESLRHRRRGDPHGSPKRSSWWRSVSSCANDLLDMPEFGCINVHASLLPRHRGVSPDPGRHPRRR
jgi:hypothetical protein